MPGARPPRRGADRVQQTGTESAPAERLPDVHVEDAGEITVEERPCPPGEPPGTSGVRGGVPRSGGLTPGNGQLDGFERDIQAALETLIKGRTTIAIAHRLSTLRRADRLVVIERGRVVEVGKHDELLGAGGLYARLHRAQLEMAQGCPV